MSTVGEKQLWRWVKITQQPIDHTGPDEARMENILITFFMRNESTDYAFSWIATFAFAVQCTVYIR